MLLKHLLVAAGFLAISAPLLARTPECTSLDKSHWMQAEALQKKLAGEGYKVIDFKVADTCYRSRLEDGQGRVIDAIYNPVGGYPVRRKVM